MITEEMKAWLGANRDQFEFYLLHAMLHDPLRRASLLAVPVTPDEFSREELALIMEAIRLAAKLSDVTGMPLPSPPNYVFMLDYLKPSISVMEADEEIVAAAKHRLLELMNPAFSEQWYSIDTFFEAWLTTARGKRYARKIQSASVADMASIADLIRRDVEAAQSAVHTEEDGMDAVLFGEDMEIMQRRTTGIAGLDVCLNGGWGAGECYLVFSGTGGGKSICAGQCALTELMFDGAPLIVSTELKPGEYVARIISNACSINISTLQDCANFKQITMAVASKPNLAFHLSKVQSIQERIAASLRIAKIRANDGLNAKSVLERETDMYLKRYKRLPSWVCLDWLGSVADVAGGARTSAERAMAWEISATSCVKFAEETGIPTLVLAQAVNDSQTKRILTLADIGISKGIAKNMVAAIGITNTINKDAVQSAVLGRDDLPSDYTLQDQLFCVCKARKGEGNNVQVRREFKYQRFIARPKGG